MMMIIIIIIIISDLRNINQKRTENCNRVLQSRAGSWRQTVVFSIHYFHLAQICLKPRDPRSRYSYRDSLYTGSSKLPTLMPELTRVSSSWPVEVRNR